MTLEKIYRIARELAPIDIPTSDFTLSGLVKDSKACKMIFEMAHTAKSIQHKLNMAEHQIAILEKEKSDLLEYIKNNKLPSLPNDIAYNLKINKGK
jgi:hypothetical protein